jgi:hypothetical protein
MAKHFRCSAVHTNDILQNRLTCTCFHQRKLNNRYRMHTVILLSFLSKFLSPHNGLDVLKIFQLFYNKTYTINFHIFLRFLTLFCFFDDYLGDLYASTPKYFSSVLKTWKHFHLGANYMDDSNPGVEMLSRSRHWLSEVKNFFANKQSLPRMLE